MRNERDWVRVQHMLEAIGRIESLLHDSSLETFLTDDLRQSAAIRQFEIIGEAAAVISADTVSAFPAVPWRQLKAFRNLLVHEYFRVDAVEVWTVYAQDLPDLKASLTIVLTALQASD
ncbi:MAG: DUF86 domain-containing protein [Hymenobacteraceae bacterium]|nr:DUF86 domain-containing protein [Hymenobacteraceae bacterium]